MANSSIRYGASIRKRNAAVKREKQALYKCEVCGKISVKRISTSIWKCKHCGTTYAGGAYTMTTTAGETAKALVEDMSRQ
jgi:large subunit ribosomal protein L37Ae